MGRVVIWPISHSAMSMPAETPWLVTTLPSRTQRASRTTVQSPRSARVPSNDQWVATRLLVASPAPTNNSEPVHTLVTHVANGPVLPSQARSVSLSISTRVPWPPGTTITSSGG